jgi:purine-binding chemotaxis protein CheW
MTTQRQLCTFFLAEHYFGIDVLEVQEVLRHLKMTRVPLAPAVVRGLINLRGQIVTAIDLRHRLDLPDRPEGKLPVNVVVKADDEAVSLLVDDIGDVLQVAEEAFERPPESLQGPARQMIVGTYRLESRLLLLLDTKKVLQIGSEA